MDKILHESVGDILLKEFMEPEHISPYYLAKSIGAPVSRILGILSGSCAITADTSSKLGEFFGISENYFLKIQNNMNV